MSEHYYVRNRFLEASRWTGAAQVSIDLNSGYEEHRPHLRSSRCRGTGE